MFVSRAIFDRVGQFHERVAEDLDWGQRAVAAGFMFRYASDAAVSHPARRDWNELSRKWRKLSREASRPQSRSLMAACGGSCVGSPF